ncbi:hypothetical protein R1flu_006120 [Riccia fluitans]|uniref:Nucleoside diphosphate kinase-like domain-containing protein n=1 Tax=Riccia fluitans TaxID=41844 RepID=A0ABD1YVQ9_9MARC
MLAMLNLWLLILAAAVPKIVTPGLSLPEKTLAMIKPDAVQSNYTSMIRQIIVSEGFHILEEKLAHLDDVAAKSFYKEHAERSFFPSLIRFMTSGPVYAMILEREGAIKKWRTLMGPTDSNKARVQAPDSIRAKFGIDGEKNSVHGSDSTEAAIREIATFFRDFQESNMDSSRRVHEEL